MENRIARHNTTTPATPNGAAKVTLAAAVNTLLDGNGYRRRFEELLGRRAPQFVGSIVSLITTTPQMQQAFADAPLTIIQSALRAATYDLPIDPTLGYAYIVPFRNSKENRMEAQFILGYKGMVQLALRTGAYKTINVMDVREGELKGFDRLTEEITIDWIEDDDARDALPIIGWAGYFRLINGTEKTIYMSRAQVAAHEKRHRKGSYMSPIWKQDFDGMAAKTVLRRLIGKWGLMSIDYQQQASPAAIAAADAMAQGFPDDADDVIDGTVAPDALTGDSTTATTDDAPTPEA